MHYKLWQWQKLFVNAQTNHSKRFIAERSFRKPITQSITYKHTKILPLNILVSITHSSTLEPFYSLNCKIILGSTVKDENKIPEL